MFAIETFEGTPAYNANIVRGDELVAINGKSVSTLVSTGGPQAVSDALGAAIMRG